MAWLNATPTAANPKLADKQDKRSRKERMDEDGEDYSLPDTSCPFLLSYLLEVGPISAGAMGAGPIGWTDLKDWQFCLGVKLPPWQCRVLIELSREYLSFSKTAESEDCPSPYSEEAITEGRREAIARNLRTGFKAILMSKEKR